MLHLHLGIKPKNLNEFFRNLNGNGLKYVIDGDGWNVWGEGVGVNGNAPDVLHVIVLVQNEEEAQKVLDLEPVLEAQSNGNTATLTDADDWAIVRMGFPVGYLNIPNEILGCLADLRDDSLALANEYSGARVSESIHRTELNYERLLTEFVRLYKK